MSIDDIAAHAILSEGNGDVVDIHLTNMNTTKGHMARKLMGIIGVAEAIEQFIL